MKTIQLILVCLFMMFACKTSAQNVTISPGIQGNLTLPKLSTMQINALISPQKGMMVYDSDIDCIKIYNGAIWRCLSTNTTTYNEDLITSWIDGGDKTERIESINTDSEGNIYVTGGFLDVLKLGGVTIETGFGSLSSQGYLAKYSPNGKFLWARKFNLGHPSVSLDMKGMSIIGDNLGNVFVCGKIAYYDASFSNNQLYIAKYNSSGTVIYEQSIGNTNTLGEVFGTKITLDINGKILIAGSFYGAIDFGNGSPISPIGSNDAFILRLNSDFTFNQIMQFGGVNNDGIASIVTDPSLNIYVLGNFSGTGFFGGSSQTAAFTNTIYLMKLNSSGLSQWFKQVGGSGLLYGKGLALDNTNQPFICGDFSGTCTFNTGLNVISTGSSDLFLVKYSHAGAFQYVKNWGGTAEDTFSGLFIKPNNEIILGGLFRNTISLGDKFYDSNGPSTYRSFILKLDANGNVLKVRTDNPNHIVNPVYSQAGFIFYSGFVSSPKLFIGNKEHVPHGNSDLYFVKLWD